jgi:hypothetical protein
MRLGLVVGRLLVTLAMMLPGSLLAVGCGGDDNDENPAVTKCHTFASTWCNATVACLVANGTLTEAARASNASVCFDTAIAAAQCKKAVSTSASYDQCLVDIKSMDCARWNVPESELGTVQPPATCQGIILVTP